jgi:hypothetical protein
VMKLMTEMGFDYDPSTAGSSVRFIPPGKDDHVRFFLDFLSLFVFTFI